jgi:hypothetical protein
MNMTIQDIDQLVGKKEPLDPALRPYLEPHAKPFAMLRHPLVFSVPYHPALNAFLNAQYRMKSKATEDALRSSKFERFVFFHERPYRWDAMTHLLAIEAVINGRRWFRLLAEVWQDSENVWQYQGVFPRLFAGPRTATPTDRKHIMTKSEQKVLAALPDPVIIYRGATKGRNELGWSWTTDHNRARWFANRFKTKHREPVLVTATVPKAHIIAYFEQRDESEIVVAPQYVKVQSYGTP